MGFEPLIFSQWRFNSGKSIEIVVEDGKHTGAKPGKVLRRTS